MTNDQNNHRGCAALLNKLLLLSPGKMLFETTGGGGHLVWNFEFEYWNLFEF